ncbi:MAG: hypothetical protein HKN25_01930 [Pyrinomonadaceae bacterium]|nr:hypothetical protein [Pyrinomonadaceae bacterium]
MKSELGILVELQKTDTRIRQLKENIESAEERRAEIEQEFEKHASSIRDIQTRRDEARESKTSLEAKIAEVNTGLERANRNLKNAQDNQQYEAAMKEIDSLNKQNSKHETGILENMETIEETEAILEERADEVNNLESDWEKQQKEFDTALAADRKEFDELTKEREKVFAQVSPKLASVYNRLVTRSRDGIAVAAVKEESCSACNMSLRKQMIVELKTTDQILTCESCTRILYVNEEESVEAAA